MKAKEASGKHERVLETSIKNTSERLYEYKCRMQTW